MVGIMAANPTLLAFVNGIANEEDLVRLPAVLR